MSFLKQDNKRANETKGSFGLITTGDYEVMAIEGKWDDPTDQTKTPRANFTFVVRSDVDQEFKGRKVFHDFYISRDPEKVETSLGFIERFNLELGVPDGVEFATQQEWINFVLGKPVKARIATKEYNGKEYNEIKWFNESSFKQVSAQATQTPAQNAGTALPSTTQEAPGSIDISDDDLPF